MKDPQYLILHKVRGQPQFDIADRATYGDEEGWSLCTCGHRAYPYWYKPLEDLGLLNVPEMPEDCPEHYSQKAEPKVSINISSILGGFVNFKRRL
jgi:hypothetical protein